MRIKRYECKTVCLEKVRKFPFIHRLLYSSLQCKEISSKIKNLIFYILLYILCLLNVGEICEERDYY